MPSDRQTAVLYHGHASPSKLEKCREASSSLTHGVEWSDPSRMPKRDEPYILDNGAYSASLSGDAWDRNRWYRLLTAAHRMPREPEWVVLPDVYGDAERTRERHQRFVEVVRSHGFDYYAVAQPGAGVEGEVQFAEALGADGVFLGGPEEWKRNVADDVRRHTDARGLRMHIGQPGNLGWALGVGVDSMDTTSIVVNDAYGRLTQLEGQQTLADGGALE